MYLVQTVTSRPRGWSSYTNVNTKDELKLKSMNSVDEISIYKQDFIEPYSRNSVKTAATTYDFLEHPPKKDKKWSFGNIFRRKKKDDSESSSEDEVQKKNFLNKKKRKNDKRKKPTKPSLAFDHIVVPQNRGSYILSNGYNGHDDAGILSDPSGGFSSYIGRPLPRIPISSEENKIKQDSLSRNENHYSHNSLGSMDSLKKGRRERTKARAIARRDSLRPGSSSDEDSQRSYSSSRFKSDESLTRQRDGSLSRRSRTARTERYIRRLSKEDESILNREALQRQTRENWHLKLPEDRSSYGRSPSRSPILSSTPKSADCYVNSAPSQPNFSGLFTIPPSHSIHSKYRTSNSHVNNPNISPVQENNYKNLENIQQNFSTRSFSCEANIHKTPSPESEILHVQLPITKPNQYRNLSLVEQPRLNINKNPPAPPPRDPRRVMPIQFDNNRPTSYCFDKVMQQRNPANLTRANRGHEYSNLWHAGYRTASEDHIPTEPKQTLTPRPSSVTNETRNQRFINRHTQESTDKFQYRTEKKPRSRKPIFIQSNDKINTTKFNENSNKIVNRWKRDSDEKSLRSSTSPQIFTSQTHLQTKVFLPSVVKADMDSQSLNSVDYKKSESNHFKPISPTLKEAKTITGSNDSIAKELENSEARKSTNLEDALDELEAIYKSLHLGDEDLLERAEQREMSIATQKLLDSKAESYPVYGINRGALSDSSFTYEPFDSLDSPKKKRYLKKSQTLDRRSDDMAYRKLNKDRANTINNPQTVIANVSYLLASPVHAPQDEIEDSQEEEEIVHDEPDITLDDVVYRTIKHANNSLKVLEPQPPFGIPIGPVTPAPNSDYLHAVPENSPPRYLPFKSKRIPDVVKDDLAFRNLRKDHNKEPALKPLVSEDLENNNSMRKKRAVRSLSANISNFIQKDRRGRIEDEGCENEFKKTSLTDIADAMEIARQILKDKDNRINTTRRAFLSDSETKYRKVGVGSASSTETITESRLNFLNDMRRDSKDNVSPETRNQLIGDDYLMGKPPRGSTPDKRGTPKESTPCLGENDKNSSFEDLLTALAVEARETSDRITKELKDLDVDLNKNNEVKESKDEELNKKLLDIDAVSEHAKLCEKLLECVVESTELIASTKTESTPIEQVEQIETLIPQSVANVVTTRVEEENVNPLDVEVHSVSDHDYENLGSDAEFDKGIPLIDEGSDLEVTSKSPFEEHKAEIIATFKELVISDNGSTDEERLEEGMLEENGGEACVLAVAALPVNKEPVCAFISESKITITNDNIKTYTSNCDIFINDESQPSSGFHSNSSCTDSVAGESNYLNTNDLIDPVDQIPSLLLESLKSPKLVTSVMKQTNKRLTEEKRPKFSDSNPNSLAKYTPSTSSSSSSHNSGQNLGKTRSWYGDPLALAFACSYGVACSYQLASLDVFTILGLFILLLSIAAALIRE